MISVLLDLDVRMRMIASATQKILCSIYIKNISFWVVYRKNLDIFGCCDARVYIPKWGWSGGAMVLGKLPVPGRPTILITVGQGPIALAVGAGGGGLDIFTLIYPFSSFSLSLGDGPL